MDPCRTLSHTRERLGRVSAHSSVWRILRVDRKQYIGARCIGPLDKIHTPLAESVAYRPLRKTETPDDFIRASVAF